MKTLLEQVPPGVLLNLQAILCEYLHATRKFGPFASAEQGVCIITEEVGELAQAVLQVRPLDDQRREAIQTGAMALRFLTDCAPLLEPEEGESRHD